MTHHEWEHVQDASRAIRARWSGEPRVGIVLGTGLGALAREIEAEATIPYPEIPHFPRFDGREPQGPTRLRAAGRAHGHGDGGAVPPVRGLFALAGHLPDPGDEGAGLPPPDRLQRRGRAESAPSRRGTWSSSRTTST